MLPGKGDTRSKLDEDVHYPRYYCLSCGCEEAEFDSICKDCRDNEHYPETIYGV